ncbi:Prolipoprotein diacylglyceryl transferase [compost metagenome]
MHPVLNLGETIAVPTYYLVITVTVCICLLWLNQRIKKSDLSRAIALDLSLVLMVSGFIGARLLHVIYENPEYYLEDFWRILYFWDGGFVFYGGALLAGLCSWLFLRWKDREQLLSYFDLFAPLLAFAYGLGRVGCLFAGCCYGRTCELPWAVAGRHPTQIYASLWELGVLFILLGLSSAKPAQRRPAFFQKPGAIFFLWMILHGAGRLMMESFRDDFRGPAFGISISSWISLGIMILGLFLLLRKPTSRGLAGRP